MKTDPEKLMSLYFNGTMTEQQAAELSEWIKQSSDNAERFVEVSIFHRSVHDIFASKDVQARIADENEGDIGVSSEDSACEMSFWQEFIKCEEDSPSVIIESKEEVIEEVPVVNINKTSKFVLLYNKIITIAAVLLIFFLVYANLFPPKYTIPVATVADQLSAKWGNNSERLSIDQRLRTNQAPLILESGFVKLQYDEGVEVLIEGPAEFTIEKKGVSLEYGRLFSSVSERGRGFTVDTPDCRFIDLGTEFGVYVARGHLSELHVIKGEVQYYAGGEDSDKISSTLTQGNAVRVYSSTDHVESISVDNNIFVRNVNSQSGILWHGQNSLNLADMVCGGNGLGQVKGISGINPVSGEISEIRGDFRKSNGKYNAVNQIPFIDGVFVPVATSPETIITSSGLSFATPDIQGEYTHEITAFHGEAKKLKSTIPNVELDGKLYFDSDILMIHSNSGITFDLNAMRNVYQEYELKSFDTIAVMSEAMASIAERVPYIDFYVLVDGEIRHKSEGVGVNSGGIPLELAIMPQDQYLTIVVTDCPDLSNSTGKNRCTDNDFFNFIEPVITIERKP